MRGDWEAAIADLNESLESSPDPLNSSYAMGWLGFSHREKGDHARAIALLEQSVASMAEFRFRRLVCVFGGFLAGAYRSAGRIEEAREAAEGALSLSEELRYPWSVALARRELGRIDLAAGDLAGAERRLGEALEAFSGMDAALRGRRHAPRPGRARRPSGRSGGRGGAARALPRGLCGGGCARVSGPCRVAGPPTGCVAPPERIPLGADPGSVRRPLTRSRTLARGRRGSAPSGCISSTTPEASFNPLVTPRPAGRGADLEV